MPARRVPKPKQLRLPGWLPPAPAVWPAPLPPRPPDPERAQREARSEATLAALFRNLATGTRATDAEAA